MEIARRFDGRAPHSLEAAGSDRIVRSARQASGPIEQLPRRADAEDGRGTRLRNLLRRTPTGDCVVVYPDTHCPVIVVMTKNVWY